MGMLAASRCIETSILTGRVPSAGRRRACQHGAYWPPLTLAPQPGVRRPASCLPDARLPDPPAHRLHRRRRRPDHPFAARSASSSPTPWAMPSASASRRPPGPCSACFGHRANNWHRGWPCTACNLGNASWRSAAVWRWPAWWGTRRGADDGQRLPPADRPLPGRQPAAERTAADEVPASPPGQVVAAAGEGPQRPNSAARPLRADHRQRRAVRP